MTQLPFKAVKNQRLTAVAPCHSFQLEYIYGYSWNDLIKWGTPYPLISVISLYSLILFYLWCVSGHLWGDPSTPIDSFYISSSMLSLSVITGTFLLSWNLLSARLCSPSPVAGSFPSSARSVQTPKKNTKKFGCPRLYELADQTPRRHRVCHPTPLLPRYVGFRISRTEGLPAWTGKGNPGSGQRFPSCKPEH